VRISAITGSIVLHVSLIAAAFTLPPPASRKQSDPVTVDLFQRKKETPPEPTPPPTPAPEPPKLAMREPARHSEPSPHPLEPPPPEPKPQNPPTQPPTSTQPPGPPAKVDLTLHALPTGPDGAASVPSGTGTFGSTPGPGERKPWKMRGDAGNPITGKLADEKEDRFPLKPVGGGELEFKGKAFSARIGRDGRVSFDDKNIRDFKGLSGGFDITDMIMRAKGDDPYRAEKAAFMKQTEAVRKKMAQAALKERIEASLAQIPRHLDEIWRNKYHPAAERRRLIYETWKDAALAEADNGDAGRDACAIVETYVRRYLPQGSEDAFTDDELERYNRNQSKKFYPYH
jgi:hypothetical protein